MTNEEAIDIVARDLLYVLVQRGIDQDTVSWEDYPELGESHWNLAVDHAAGLAPRPDRSAFQGAYKLLGDQAEGEV